MKKKQIQLTHCLLLPSYCFLLLVPLLGRLTFSGSFHPYGMYRLSDGSEIALPQRVIELNVGYAVGDFEFMTNSVLEYRWSNSENSVDLREAYVTWYPSFGEVKFGRQIISWGAADGNNPTDNLNAYDYYYMFLPGADRKQGTLSAAINVYLGDWQIEAVLIPEHLENRLPFDEKDFPVIPFVKPSEKQMIDVENPLEYGIRLKTMFLESDISLSYFRGHDRSFTPFNKMIIPVDTIASFPPAIVWAEIPDKFGYRSTGVLGADFVTFFGDFTFREEIAYFTTQTGSDYNLPLSAEYIQYISQIEYASPLDINFTAQLIGSKNIRINDNSVPIEVAPAMGMLPEEAQWDNEEAFIQGMGTPFAMFVERSLLLSASGTLFDQRLELNGNTFFNLDEAGFMMGIGVDYSPVENWNLELSMTKFIGDSKADSDNFFNTLEDFSHIIVGLKYSF